MPTAEITVPDLQQKLQCLIYGRNLIQIEKNVVLLLQKVIIYVNFSIVSFKQEMRKSLYQRNHKLK